MKKTLLIIIIFFLFCVPEILFANSDTSLVQISQYKRDFRVATSKEEKYKLLTDIETASRDIMGSEKEEVFLFLGHRYYALGDVAKSRYLFNKVINEAIDRYSRADAARMLGQISMSSGDFIGAEKAYSMMPEIFNSDATLSPRFNDLYREFCTKIAFIYQQQNKYDSSTNYREALLANADSAKFLSPKERRILYTENGRDYTRLKNPQKAVPFYDRVLKEFPDYGKDNGIIVNLEYERINAFCLPETNNKRLKMINELWNKPEYADYSQIFVIGSYLAKAYESTDNKNAMANVLQELIFRISSKYNAFSEVEKDRNIDIIYQNALNRLACYYEEVGDYASAEAMYKNLIKLFPKLDYIESIKTKLNYCIQNAIDTQYLLDIQEEIDNQADANTKTFKTKESNYTTLKLPVSDNNEVFALNLMSLAILESKINDTNTLDSIKTGNLAWNGNFVALNGTKLFIKENGIMENLRYMDENLSRIYLLPKKLILPLDLVIVDNSRNIFSVQVLEIKSNAVVLGISKIKETK